MKFTIIIAMLLQFMTPDALEPVGVTDQTIKIGSMKEEILYFGFAEGDKIIFNFQEVDKKELKEVEIVEYPTNSKFSDFKTKQIENKTFMVPQKGVYMFRFKNSALGGRICKINIQRIPANENTLNFNTAVIWVTKQDTTWNTYVKDVIIGYDTSYLQKSRRELVKIDTILSPLFDKSLRVHSETAYGKTQYTYASVEFPKNSFHPSVLYPYRSTEVISWSYWLGVGQKATEDYEKANKSLKDGIKVIGALTGYGALATLATTGISIFTNTTLGDNVIFKFHCLQNGQPLTIDYGNVISSSGRNTKILQGAFSIELYNDNFKDGIDVTIKMIVVQVSKTWEDVSYTEQKISPRTEKQLFRDPIVKTYRIPVTGM
jgi:hypothetical protein